MTFSFDRLQKHIEWIRHHKLCIQGHAKEGEAGGQARDVRKLKGATHGSRAKKTAEGIPKTITSSGVAPDNMDCIYGRNPMTAILAGVPSMTTSAPCCMCSGGTPI